MRCDPQLLPLANKIDKLLQTKEAPKSLLHLSLIKLGFLALLLLMSTTTTATAIANIGLDHHRYNHDSRSAATGSSGTASSKPDQVAIQVAAPPLSRYESQKRRDWNTFGQYLKNQRPPISLSHCSYTHVLEFMRYLDQFGKTKVHLNGCVFFGQPDPPAPCTCPLRQAWGSLDALIGRLRAAYEEHGGSQESNPFGNGAIRVYLREVRDCQSKARGIPYKKKKRKLVHHITKQQTDMANDAQHNKLQALLKEHPSDI